MRWVILFLIATIGSGVLGFGATSPIAGSLGQLLFGICLIMFLVALMVRAMQKGGPARTNFGRAPTFEPIHPKKNGPLTRAVSHSLLLQPRATDPRCAGGIPGGCVP